MTLAPASSRGEQRVDLGVVHAASLATGGAQTLFTPTIGSYVELTMGTSGYVAHNAFTFLAAIASDLSDDVYWFSFGLPTTISQAVFGFKNGWVIRDTPVVALLKTDTNSLPILTAPPAWAANHLYAANFLILGPDNHIWSSTTGTSGGSIPNFAANEGGTVVDGGVTWTDEGAIPTTGTIHLYALIS